MDIGGQVAAGAGWSVSSSTDLAHVISELLDPASAEARLKRARQHELCKYHDGHASDRIVRQMFRTIP